jgi:hypothetical protein
VEPLIKFFSSLISILIFIVAYGTRVEHGDSNAGANYGIISILPALIITLISISLYYVFDLLTDSKKFNWLKMYVHLILFAALPFLKPNELLFPLLIISLSAILLINLVFYFIYNQDKNLA